MALTAEHSSFIAEVGDIADTVVKLLGRIEVVNTLWNGSPNWDALVTDVNISEMPGLAGAGLTNAKLANAIFTLETAVRQGVLSGNIPDVILLSRLK